MSSIRKVAAVAKVSKSTVASVIRDERYVSEEKRRRVLEAIESTGYRSNPMVTALMSQLRQNRSVEVLAGIAWLCDSQLGEIPVERRLYEAARARAEALGFSLERFNYLDKGLRPERLADILESRGIRSVFVAPPKKDGQRIELPWERFAATTIAYTLAYPILNRVVVDHYHGAIWLMHHLRARGYRRIGLALPAIVEGRHHNIFKAVLFMLQAELPSEENVAPYLPLEWERDDFLRWFEDESPDIVVTIEPDVLVWLQAQGVAIPGEIGLATMHYTERKAPMCGLSMNIDLTARSAIDLIAGQVYRNEYGLSDHPKTVVLPPVWVEGSTLVKARQGVSAAWKNGETYPLPESLYSMTGTSRA